RLPRRIQTMLAPNNKEYATPQAVYSLHRGRTKKPILLILPDQSGLFRIDWPDIGLSAPANLTRCKQAAEEWAAQCLLADHRNLSVAQRLKSLNFFWRSASVVRSNDRGAV